MLNTEKNMAAPPASDNTHGKVVLITGGTGGIGRATAEALAGKGATTLIVGRHRETGEAAVTALKASSGNNAIAFFPADLSSQDEIRHLAQEVLARYPHIHVLMNNVGNMQPQRTQTVDGLELTFALNVLAPFLLTNLLLPALEASVPARIINVNSMVYRYGAGLDVNDLLSRQAYRPMKVYSQAKFANLLLTYECARRLAGTGVTVNAVDPGFTIRVPEQGQAHSWSQLLAWPFLKLGSTIMTDQRAAQSSVYAASSPALEGVSGTYITTAKKPVASSKASYDEERGRRIWQACAELIGLEGRNELPLVPTKREGGC
jgi:NAD(P)-dependent dehydrogenase (short-subunit alcohol dehydrogenase family)